MVNWMEKFTDKLIENGANPENRGRMIYGFIGTFIEIVANIAAFTIAFSIGKPLEMLIWQVFWLPSCVNIGGHHAKHHITCLIYCTALAVIILVPFRKHSMFSIVRSTLGTNETAMPLWLHCRLYSLPTPNIGQGEVSSTGFSSAYWAEGCLSVDRISKGNYQFAEYQLALNSP